jgi:hypothetical protein
MKLAARLFETYFILGFLLGLLFSPEEEVDMSSGRSVDSLRLHGVIFQKTELLRIHLPQDTDP